MRSPAVIATARAGATLVEVVIALMLLSVGVLASAATVTAVNRLVNDGARRVLAAGAAVSQIEHLHATCGAGGSITAPVRVTLEWSIGGQSPVSRGVVTVTARYHSRSGPGAVTVVSRIACP